jgi:hypothetical protein
MKSMLQLFGAHPSLGAARWYAPVLRYFPARFDLRTLLRPGTGALRPVFAATLLLIGTGSAVAATHYVDVNSTNPMPPYTNWATAATNIQDAVDAAVAGDQVVVTNGIYAGGGRNGIRVEVDKPLNVRSVNGPQFTIISGGGVVPCAYLTNNVSLSGFTLTNGFSPVGGGGVRCESSNAVVSNCVIGGNWAYALYPTVYGGGAYGGTLNNCSLVSNSVSAGNVYPDFGEPYDANALGGGAAYCTLNNCTLSGNWASASTSPDHDDYGSLGISQANGGGAYHCTLNNCTLSNNSAGATSIVVVDWFSDAPQAYALGGGAAYCTLNNCTLVANSARAVSATPNPFPNRYAYAFGGASGGTLNNCISFTNYANYNNSSGCEDCGSPGRLIGNNWVGDPLFVDTNGWANLRLQSGSPCINAGNNSYATNDTDLDGNPRISGGTVDIGAYEYQWPQLTIAPSGPNVLLTWPTNNAGYDYTGFTLQSTTNLVSPVVWSTSSPAPVVIGGQNTVTNPIIGAQKFYRLVH